MTKKPCVTRRDFIARAGAATLLPIFHATAARGQQPNVLPLNTKPDPLDLLSDVAAPRA